MGFKGFHISKEKQKTCIPFLHCGQEYQLAHGSVVIAAVISCTNNCNPSVMLTAGKALSQQYCQGKCDNHIMVCTFILKIQEGKLSLFFMEVLVSVVLLVPWNKVMAINQKKLFSYCGIP